MRAYPAKAILCGFALAASVSSTGLAGSVGGSDYATLQAAAQKAKEERTAQAPEQQPAPQAPAAQGKQEQSGDSGGLTESQVRVMLGLAWSVVPEEYQDPDGKPVKVDKQNPNRYLIPVEDARRIIRVASRTAYAQICNLQEHQISNYEAMMQLERKQKDWTNDQLMFINTLHLFAVAQMTGGVTIEDAPQAEPGEAQVTKAKPVEPQQEEKAQQPREAKPVEAGVGCPPAQKEKVRKAIDQFVAFAEKQS